MHTSNIATRPATKSDALMIAEAVAMAIGDKRSLVNYCGEDYLAVLTAIATAEGTQYSWQNAIVAEYDGSIVGAVVGYNGALLGKLREGTLAIVRTMTGRMPSVVDETEAGEYYLDSLAVVPEYRGKGVGVALLRAFCRRAFAEGAKRVGLIVDIENPNAERLYTAEGFVSVGERPFFGHQMRHLQKER